MRTIFSVFCGIILATSPALAADNIEIPDSPFKAAPEETEFTNYICEGTRWEMFYTEAKYDNETHTNTFTDKRMRLWLEESIIINGDSYMTLMRAYETDNYENSYPIAYIRYDNGKVYERFSKKPEAEEILLYDFNLDVNDSCVLYYDETFPELTAECSAISEITNEGGVFEVMEMNFTGELYISPENGGDGFVSDPKFDYKGKMKWIKGLGSINGILSNIGKLWKLDAIYHDDILIYKPTNEELGVSEIPNAEVSRQTKAYHLDGTPFREGDKGICIENGKKIIK
ncbi:MAG: hypothetical protein HDS12_01455 [Bacteroides sp.]|nr:hypothetical protein [Bacteroides sp.]